MIENGYTWVRGVLADGWGALPVSHSPIRDVLAADSPYRALALHPELRSIASSVLGKPAWVVRANLFAKSAGADWFVPWHQDVTVCVRKRRGHSGFSNWTRKGGVDHAAAPLSVLRRMVALRLHLDACPANAGPLEVLPRTHHAMHDAPARERSILSIPATILTAAQGDVLVMSPLLLHRSCRMDRPMSRRVLHVEFACQALPDPLQWQYEL